MKVAFYLPVVTPWWFENIIVHLIRRIAKAAEVHVLVPPLWSGTGVGIEQLRLCGDIDGVEWHLLDGDEHPALRTPGVHEEVVALVAQIAPDYSLCRSADIDTPSRFPGKVRHLMEGGAPPFPTDQSWIVLRESLFDHGCLPALEPELRAELDRSFAPAWTALRQRLAAADRGRELALEQAGLPAGRTVVSIPLDYEHQENFFDRFNRFPSNAELIEAVADAASDEIFLAVTDHPLNERHGKQGDVAAQIAAMPDRARLLPNGTQGKTTAMLARHADGVIIQNGKSFATAGFFGTPLMRASPFATGAWLHAYDSLDGFLGAVGSASARRPDQDAACSWFAYHLANNIIDPHRSDLTVEELIDRIERPCDPARWEDGIARYARHRPELFA